MRTFGYVRVSTIEQESGFGPEVQEKAIREYVAEKGLGEIEMVHESFSGETIFERKEFVALLAEVRELARAGETVHLVFFSSDRLSRELMSQESVVASSFEDGFRLHSTRSHEADLFNPAYARDPMRTAIRQFFGIFNQLEKAMIRSRLDGGLFAKAATGGSTGGRYPFGYQSINGEITVCVEEAPVIRRAFELLERKHSLGKVAIILGREFPDHCGHWDKNAVKRLRERTELYRLGQYRSRMSPDVVVRPELIIAPIATPVSAYKQESLSARKPIDWAAVPDPVAGHSLSILIGKQVPWIKAKVMELGLSVRWDKSRLIIPKETARKLAQMSGC